MCYWLFNTFSNVSYFCHDLFTKSQNTLSDNLLTNQQQINMAFEMLLISKQKTKLLLRICWLINNKSKRFVRICWLINNKSKVHFYCLTNKYDLSTTNQPTCQLNIHSNCSVLHTKTLWFTHILPYLVAAFIVGKPLNARADWSIYNAYMHTHKWRHVGKSQELFGWCMNAYMHTLCVLVPTHTSNHTWTIRMHINTCSNKWTTTKPLTHTHTHTQTDKCSRSNPFLTWNWKMMRPWRVW